MMSPSTSSNSTPGSIKPLTASSLGRFDNSLPSKEVLDLWQKADAVCFDVDSTVCVDEGIDELAEFCGAGKAVAEWTARAMGGSVPFEEALAVRLDLFKPSLARVQDFLEKRPPRLSPGIHELVQKLKESGKTVYLISGGFRQMINPVASILGVPTENIFANQLLFDTSGEFAGFDVNEPTSRSGGKPTAVELLRKTHGYKTVVMIGDGATDLEARKPGCADLFICYGGVQLREAVSTKADWLVFNFKDLINSLEYRQAVEMTEEMLIVLLIVFTLGLSMDIYFDLMKPGASVIIRYGKIDMFKGSMRLAVDKWGRIDVTDPVAFQVNEYNNLSLVEYELVNVSELSN
ncbi:phosphoserine phosphatase, chloroplastic [Tanacetum coccineum]